MKEILLVFGFAGVTLLLTVAVTRWSWGGKLRSVGTMLGQPNISFWQRLLGAFISIGIAITLVPILIIYPWEKSKTATVLGITLLLGFLIHWAREEDQKVSGGGRSRFSLGAVVGILAGLAFLALTAFLVVKILQEIDYGLSNAPERMALRGYVPRESVAAALAAAQPALPEVHTVIAPVPGAWGEAIWSESIVRSREYNTYFSVPDGVGEFVEARIDGAAITNFLALAKTKPGKCEFRSRATNSIEIKWWKSIRVLTPQEIEDLGNN